MVDLAKVTGGRPLILDREVHASEIAALAHHSYKDQYACCNVDADKKI
jgi:hypothetical protein